jgi:ubiquinone biosynthesis protein UbiJ
MSTLFGSFASTAAKTAWGDSAWAMTHLLPHAGKILRVELFPPLASSAVASFAIRVTDDGNWEPAGDATANPADATLKLTPRVGVLLAQLPEKPGAALDLTGNAEFVSALRDLHDVLPIAIEDRVSAFLGPLVAHALTTTMRSVARWPAEAANRVGAGAAAWGGEEQRTLVGRPAFDRFAADVAALAERAGQLLERHPL